MDKKQFDLKYNEYKNIVENYIESISRIPDCPQKRVFEACRYSIMAGGKRVRPVLMLAFADMYNVPLDIVLPFAGALEMIHTYSLIHDDLPAMDNDDFRRGNPTNHKVYGEAIAILAGDALLNGAFELTSEAVMKFEYKYMKNGIEALNVLAGVSGSYGMIAGQVADMEGEKRNLTEEQLIFTHKHKTGALLKASCVIPVVLAGKHSHYKNTEELAECMGMIFQIKDDILDVTSSDDVLGKPTGSDKDQGKCTFVTVYGVEKCISILNDYKENALKLLGVFGGDVSFLESFICYLADREK